MCAAQGHPGGSAANKPHEPDEQGEERYHRPAGRFHREEARIADEQEEGRG